MKLSALSSFADRHQRPATPEGDSLKARGVAVHFDSVKAVDGVDLDLERGEILGLIGPNGAGKTTLVNALSGFQDPTAGRVWLGEVEVTGWAPHRLARRGLSRTFQNIRLFPFLSALENVQAAAVSVGLRRGEAVRWAHEVLERMSLEATMHLRAGTLPHGDERRLGIARALATRPRFLLLDEPAAGLNEAESDQIVTALRGIHESFACGLLVIEHDMRVIMRLCDRIQVLDYGKTIAGGSPAQIRADPAVLAAYLGSEEALRHVET